jgi:TPR repeat protein
MPASLLHRLIATTAVLLIMVLAANAGADEKQAVQGAGTAEDAAHPASAEAAAKPGQAPLPAAVVWYLEKAKKGDKVAQYDLGTVYETGFGVLVDEKEAAKWFLKAAEQDHVLAQLKLGILYYLGKGVRESSIKGDKWIRAAAKSGNELATLLQDKVLAPDITVEIDVKKVVGEVHQALDKGDIYAREKLIRVLAKLEKEQKNQPKKERFAGNVTGSGAKPGTVKNAVPAFLDKDKGRAVHKQNDFASIRRAAKEGEAESQYRLGHMFETGQKVERDAAQAVKWYTSAALQGHREAQYRLALAYIYGIGIDKNIAKGGEWLSKAAAQKYEAARQLLAYFKSGKAGAVEYNKSVLLSIYLERALNGDGDAQLALGYMLENGWGVEANAAEARRWLVKARASGTKDAAVQLRRMKIAEAVDEAPAAASFTSTAETARPVTHAANPVKKVFEEDMPTSSRFQSLFIPIGLILIGLVLGMIVFRWMDRVYTRRGGEQDEKEESVF